MRAPSPPLACSNCNLRGLCLPEGLGARERKALDSLVEFRRKIIKGQTLFSSGMPFRSVFAVRSGVFKTMLLNEDGREQVTGFQLSADLMGMDGIVEGEHRCDAVALEDAEVCEIPFDRLGRIAQEVPAMQHHVHRVMSRAIVRDSMLMLLLGHAQADERLAAFLVDWRQRMLVRGFSGSHMILRMTRQELGSYLALTFETVSRTLSKFAKHGLLSVAGREIQILDIKALTSAGKGQAVSDAAPLVAQSNPRQAGQTEPCSGTTTRRCSSRSMR
jgi:CRP/FNR family transcriptional regulator